MRQPTVSEDALLAIALEAAEAAAEQLVTRFEREPVDVRTKSTETDPVSAADLAAEDAIRRVLGERRPADAILGEEGGLTPAADGDVRSELRWIVDPLDGTVNYLYGIPQFAVSVAVEDPDGMVAGVVINPVTTERISATRSGEALRVVGAADPEPLAARGETRLDRALVATGFGYDPAIRAAQGRVVARLLPRVRDVRRAGAAALDLCSAASGRVDAYYERGVKLWDVAAGVLVCERVGLAVRRLPAVPGDAGSPGAVALPEGVVVAPAALIDELFTLVAGASA